MAQKEICIANNVPVYSAKNMKKIVGYIPKGAIFRYEGGGYLTYRKIKGYTPLTKYFCPTNSNGWIAAVSKVAKKIPSKPGGSGVCRIAQNEVIRVLPSSSKNGWVKCAVENDGWFWSFYIKKTDYITVDNFAYDSIAKFTNL
ncbi:hypothetical protein E4S99_15080 [Listeria monocytogenes]|uniref:hypothetical protein n=1 Tax=Listeria monocytogenes TaxID=1639 RepID=UPI000E71B925|nr:hypothetical protein [Listeria monocytogenes]EAC2921751.1 hypothetical protein [Listeria monocytogenes]EAC5867597.1 hypothetical protein [Listeria monocytogenes]EAC8118352.1 hypothetical protein [Listeria monocytogenes]EAD2103884.1 hypothetical protein [Listeria monocytogenes]EAD3070709.1 hypothetical protein [Listeria monocytogenes]